MASFIVFPNSSEKWGETENLRLPQAQKMHVN